MMFGMIWTLISLASDRHPFDQGRSVPRMDLWQGTVVGFGGWRGYLGMCHDTSDLSVGQGEPRQATTAG